jgi:hypothetical protein
VKKVALTMLAMAGTAASPCVAQTKPDLEGEQLVMRFARCIVREAPQEAVSLLETAPSSVTEGQQAKSMLMRHVDCLDLPPSLKNQGLAAAARLGEISLSAAFAAASIDRRVVTFSDRAFRGAIAERLYLSRAKPARLVGSNITEASGSDASMPVGYLVVRCAAGRDPADADRLVRSKRLSPEETNAAKALAPMLQECDRGRGRVDISGTAIHGWMAEALYHQQGAVMAQRR